MKRVYRLFATAFSALLLLQGMTLCTFATSSEQEYPSRDVTRELRLSKEGKAYYVSSSLGDDRNDGLSEKTPWKSFAHLFEIDLKAGDRVLLRRGDVWHERLTIRGRGREDAWIFVGAYGELTDAKPEISLENRKDDIAILATDISVEGQNGFGLDYIWIDNVKVSNSMLGIYFRYDTSEDNEGIRVTNCSFSNINCPELMEEAMTDVGFLMQKKGHMEDYQNGRIVKNGGGIAEYIWPTAINIGGRPPLPLANVTVEGRAKPSTVVSGIELYQNEFDGCIIAVGANCYNYHFGTGPNQCYTYTTDWSVCGLTATNTMTVLNIDSADFGYDGTEESRWGRWKYVQAKSGMEDYTMSFGTTQALFSCCKNLYISHSSFNDCHNNGQPDGCGFDFERAVHNFTLDSCVFANNQGQGILVMQTTMEDQVTGETVYTPNTKNTVKNCLFYNNMNSVCNENYRYDITVFNPNNENFVIKYNHFYFRERTEGGADVEINAKVRGEHKPYGPEREGMTGGRNTMVCSNVLPPLENVLAELDMTASTTELSPVEKTWFHYTEAGVLPLETVTETAEIETGESETASACQNSPEETQDGAADGCGAAFGGVAAIPTCAAVTAALLAKKKRGKK